MPWGVRVWETDILTDIGGRESTGDDSCLKTKEREKVLEGVNLKKTKRTNFGQNIV